MIVSVVSLYSMIMIMIMIRIRETINTISLFIMQFNSLGEPHVISRVFGTQRVGYQGLTIIHRFLYSSDMCSCRACSTNA